MSAASRRLATVITAVGLLAATGSAAAVADQPVIRAATPNGGIAYLPAIFDLEPTASGTWSDTGLQVTLPRRGTYDLDVNVRGRLSGIPSINTYISARLWDVTSGAALPNSERLVDQIIDLNPGSALTGDNTTAPISERITVNRPTTIRLEAARFNAVGASVVAEIYSDGVGATSFRFERVAQP